LTSPRAPCASTRQRNCCSRSAGAPCVSLPGGDRARLKLILRGKRFGFSLEEIRQLLDLYDMGDSQQTQLARTYDLARKHLAEMEAQRAELDEAITELKAQMDWGAAELARRSTGAAA